MFVDRSALAGRVERILVKSVWLLHLKLEFCYGELTPEVRGSLHHGNIDTRNSSIRILESSDYHTVQHLESRCSQGS